MVIIRFPDGKETRAEAGKKIVEYLPPDPERRFLAAKVDGKLVDLKFYTAQDGDHIEILDFGSEEGREVYWHSSSHILAQAVKELFPDAKMTIGPPIEGGFYYDFDTGGYAFTPEDLQRIEERMRDIIRRDLEVKRQELPRDEAIRLFEERKEPYKVELLQTTILDPVVPVYWQGDFVDLCRGPHLPSTGYVKAVKVLSSSSAYWRGDERGPVLQRIYGVSFPSEEMLQEHLRRLEEARKRDHRRLGKDLDLFSVSEAVGPGLILWHPKGALVRRTIENFLFEEHLRRGYQPVYTPHIGRATLWQISGHLDFYRENMYAPMKIEEEEYFVKPMNCPFHIQIYKSQLRSYRDLPIRYTEFGTVYRYERSGVLHGLMRVRGFTQDDAHIFCRPDQVEDEILGVIDFTLFVLRAFGFREFEVYISTRPERYVGSEEMWELATQSLIRAAGRAGLKYRIDEGEGAFYGPKIDVVIRDALGRDWQCSTIQFDFNLPEKFNLKYRDADGKDKRPYMIHRALLGSMERFFGILIEHYGGHFPLWLAPVQAMVLPVTDQNHAYAREIYRRLREAGFRVELDLRNEKIGKKIREAELQKIPYMLVVGKREQAEGTVAVRVKGKGDLGAMPLDSLIEQMRREVAHKSGGLSH